MLALPATQVGADSISALSISAKNDTGAEMDSAPTNGPTHCIYRYQANHL